MALDPGTVVSGYRIERVLGSGGMGTVYLARNPMLPRSDALKILSAEFSQDPAFRTRFTQEADLAASLDHPNVVTVYTRGETTDGQLWIAMQYVPGTDADAEGRAGRISAQRAVYVVAEVARALDYAHHRNLLHRDVKPANFLLAPGGAGEPERVLLADFGIARALDDSLGLTVTGMVLATVAYAAPETLNGGAVDGRADVYSLGCALYRMLAGKTPFGGSGGMGAVVAAHLTQPAPRITDTVPTLPAAMNDVIATAMAKDPGQRYQSAREFARAAADALHDRRPAPPPPQYRPPPSTSPPRYGPPGPPTGPTRPTQPGGFGGFPPGGGPIPAARSTGDLPHPAFPPAVRARRRRLPWILGALIAAIALTVGAVIAFTGSGTPDAPGYSPQSFVHAHGTTRIGTRPTKVAALGPGDADAVLSLGVQPVVIGSAGAQLPSWEQQLVAGTPTVLTRLDVSAVQAASPDLIIATGDIDDASYAALAKVAATVTRPPNIADPQWTWQKQLDWIGQILGRQDKAKQLTDAATARQRDLRNQHPAFEGKTVEAINVTDAGVAATLAGTNTANYLQGLGFRYTDALARTPADTGDVRAIPDPATLNQTQPDVRIIVRTDAAAADGYNGLPPAFTERNLKVTTVIVADPNVVSALATGGYAATEYLDSAFVDAVASQLH
jgi:eukaryotic-like serine/threonine-protein kinase